MTARPTLSAAILAGRKDRPPFAGVFREDTPTRTVAFLIANPELEFSVSYTKICLLKIPNRKYLTIFHLAPHPCFHLTTRRSSPGCAPRGATCFLIANPRLEISPTTRKQRPAAKSNCEQNAILQTISVKLERGSSRRSSRRHLSPGFLITRHSSFVTLIPAAIPHASDRDSAHRFSRPKTFSASAAVLDFAQQSCSKENFSAITADRWNFGLCATIPREPRQARKGATVTGQLRVPRNTRSSSYRARTRAKGYRSRTGAKQGLLLR
jgi:hypothetical protein